MERVKQVLKGLGAVIIFGGLTVQGGYMVFAAFRESLWEGGIDGGDVAAFILFGGPGLIFLAVGLAPIILWFRIDDSDESDVLEPEDSDDSGPVVEYE